MKRLLVFLLFATALLAQSGGQTIWIPIKTPGTLGYGQTFSQDLGVAPIHFQPTGGNGIYILHVLAANPLNNYPGEWEVELTFGTQKLCDDYVWGTGPYAQVTVICPSPGYLVIDQSLPGPGPAQGSNDLVLTWTVNDGSSNGGWPINFQDAWLTFTPIN